MIIMCTWSGSKPDYAVKFYANLVVILNVSGCGHFTRTPHTSYRNDSLGLCAEKNIIELFSIRSNSVKAVLRLAGLTSQKDLRQFS